MESTQMTLEDEFSFKSEIIDLLNDFGESVVDNYSPLTITKGDFFALFDLAKEQLRHIKETIYFNTPRVFGCLVTFAFKALFIGENDIKIDNIEQNTDYFRLILIYNIEEKIETIKDQLIDSIEKLKANEKAKQFLGEKITSLFKKIFTNTVIFFIYLLMINNEPTILELNEFLIKLVETRYIVTLKFKYNELESLSFEQIINDLHKALITENIDNNFQISIEGDHLKVSNVSNEELLNYINAPDLPKKYKRKERKKSKYKKNSADKNIIKKTKDEKEKKIEDKKDNINEDKKENINIKGDKTKEMESQDIEQKFEKIQKEINELKKYKEENEKYKEENEKYKEENEKYKEENERYKEENERYKEESENYKEENEMYKRKSKMEIDSLKQKISQNKTEINSLNQKNSDNKLEILRLKSDLQLIKIRSSLKVFVNYMYVGLKLYGDFDYESKITKIIYKLNSFTSDNSKEYDPQLLSSFQEFMSNFTHKVDLGNLMAHKMNLDISILDQIFELLDKKKKYENVKLFLKKNTNADIIIKELVKNREKNFLNKKLLKDEEAKISMKITDLKNLWTKGKKSK